MSIATRCRHCGRAYEVDWATILDGPCWWRRCPDCRRPLPPAGGGPAADGGRLLHCPPVAA